MSAWQGVSEIVRLNWPSYAAGVAALAAGAVALASGWLAAPWDTLVLAGMFVAGFWLLASLAVSHYVYDRSGVARGAWLAGIAPGAVHRAAVFHAGKDEASATAARVLPGAAWRCFDVHDPARNGTPSLERARARARAQARDRSPAEAVPPDRIPLDGGALDLGLVVFAAHEIRRDAERLAFFRELARVLAPGGRLLVVEHLRDAPNLLAFGPGALHFLSRRTWTSAFGRAGLAIVRESACTPFVRVFELGRAA